MLLTLAVAVQDGQFGLRRQIKVQSAEAALRAVSQKYVLDRHINPRCASPAQHALNLPIAHLITTFGNKDPPPQPKLAIPVSTICAIATKYTFSLHHQVVTDMTVIAFSYLLRVSEYTSPCNLWANHTILLQICDVRLWRQGQLLNHESTLAPLLQADSATIAIANTKNGTKGVVVHHDAIGGSCCPVAALAQQIANLHGMQPTTPFITLCLPRTGTSQITDRDITIVVHCLAVTHWIEYLHTACRLAGP
jgi:hypothetical protein